MAGVAEVATSVRTNRVQRIIDDAAPIVSANLCDALVDMMPKTEDADLRIGGSWSPLLGAPEDVQSVVTIERDMYEAIEGLSEALRPRTGPTESVFAGYVVRLDGGPSTTGEVEGEVLLDVTLPDGDRLSVKVALNPTHYKSAAAAHLSNALVTVAGVLHRAKRGPAELREPRAFNVIA
jgi:hypothetical protein